MKVLTETVSPFAENTYFLVDPESKQTVLIDPGDEAPRLTGVIREQGLEVRLILCTHGHLDHVGAVAEMHRATGAPVHLHEADEFLLEGLPAQASLFSLPVPEVPEVNAFLKEGDVLHLGAERTRIEVLETPGHSPGSVTFAVAGMLFSGDALFAGSIGRTDLPGGDYNTLMRSIRERLLAFPDDTLVYPGHGEATTIGQEKRTNPFLLGQA